jgi:hypothetical protein
VDFIRRYRTIRGNGEFDVDHGVRAGTECDRNGSSPIETPGYTGHRGSRNGEAFFLLNAPVNAVFAGWRAATLPADWPGYRRQWELGHAIAFVLAPTAFCTLLRAAFVEASARRGAIERRAASVDGA